LAVTLIELRREGLPKLAGAATWKARTADAHRRAASGEYLNFEFGYKPLANEVATAAAIMVDADRLITQYMRDAGKQVRRRYAFPPIVSVQETVIDSSATAALMGPSNSLLYATQTGQGRVIRRRETTRRVWFSGAFTYHLPIDPITMGIVSGRKRSLSKLLGLDLDPNTLWGATPWSWAVDWVTNTGDLISNLQSWTRDGMVLRYGYVMEHTIVRDDWIFVGRTGLADVNVRPPVISFVAETKLRRKATPFGFGLSYGSFSNRQKAIIAALGLSQKQR